ncbi:hypothetical protein [Jannaschia formosa]|uniref:hypothetical protein n=1 Tax=Jannaschia formosa TaxID=2259592 RepID=UPI000E1BA8D0|nr:hypothetical protein [Jannaschia formosa]TFL17385.1 hypothetical protein DR046_15445 [Jannaschia formosa]
MKIVATCSALTEGKLETVMSQAFRLYGVDLVPRGGPGAVRILASPPCPGHEAAGVAFAASGYHTSPPDEAARLAAEALRQPGDVAPGASIGGLHTAHVTDGARGLCWPSIPASGGLYHARFGRGVLVSNRPRLIAACIGAQVDPRYVDYLITTGYPLDDTTPFAGVKAVRGHEALRLEPEGARIVRRGLAGMGQPNTDRQGAMQAEAVFREELLRAVSAVSGFDAVELRLSGGKDSRLLASALRAQGIDIVANTRGFGDDFTVAALVADTLGLRHLRTSQPIPERSLLSRTRTVLTLTDGLIETEAHRALSNLSEPCLDGQDGVIYGHSHLQKGGMAKTMSQQHPERARAALEAGIVPSYVRAGPRAALVDEVRAVADRFDYALPIDLLYFPYAVLRAGRYLEPLYAKIESRFTPIFPLNDERVYVAVSNLNRRRRTREVSAFSAIEHFAPALAALPLVDDRWRFQTAEEQIAAPEADLPPAAAELRAAVVEDIRHAADALRGTAVLARARELLEDEILQRCGLIDGKPGRRFEDFGRRHREKLVMRLWFAHQLEDWLAEG